MKKIFLGVLGAVLALVAPAGSQTFTPPTQVVDVSKGPYYVVADGVTDWTTQIQAAVTAAEAMGYAVPVLIPANPPNGAVYCIKNGPIVQTQTGDIIMGASIATVVSACGGDHTVFKQVGSRQQIHDLTIYGKGINNDTGTFGATQPVIQVTSNGNVLHDLLVYGGSHAIQLDAGELWMYNIFGAQQSYGSAVFYSRSAGFYYNVSFDQQAPTPGGCTYSYLGAAWTGTHAYTCGQVVTLSFGGYNLNIEAQANCTSGGGAPTPKNYAINFSDGGCTWQLVGPVTYYGVQLDTDSGENIFTLADMTGIGVYSSGLAMTNTFAGATPVFLECNECVIASGISHSVDLEAGQHAHFLGGELAVFLGGSWLGEYAVDGAYNGSVRYSVLGSSVVIAGVDVTTTWTAYSPGVPSCQAGSLTSASSTGRYKKIGKTVFVGLSVIITTVGTCAGYMIFTLPVTSLNGGSNQSLAASTSNNTLVSANIAVNSTQLFLLKYDGTSAAINQSIYISGVYESN